MESPKIIIFLREEKKISSQERTFLPQRFANERKADKNERIFFFICKRQMRQWHHNKQKKMESKQSFSFKVQVSA